MESIHAVGEALAAQGYLADRALATSVFLAGAVGQPLLLEGEAGVGKTEVARALAAATGAELIRLQCHEGIDVHHALYDWDHPGSCSRCAPRRSAAAAPTSTCGRSAS
jgi:MoxR-like ATPase